MSGHLISKGVSMGAGEDESLCRQAVAPLKPGSSVILGTGLGDLVMTLSLIFLAQLVCTLLLFDVGLSSPHTPTVVPLPQLTKSQRGLSGRGSQLGRMQYLCPARETATGSFSLSLLLMPLRGNIWLFYWPADSSQWGSWFFSRNLMGAANSVGTSVGLPLWKKPWWGHHFSGLLSGGCHFSGNFCGVYLFCRNLVGAATSVGSLVGSSTAVGF